MSQNVLTNVTIKVISQAESALRSFQNGLNQVDKGIKAHKESLKAVSEAAVVFGGAIVGAIALSARAAQEQIRAEQQLGAVLKSTGGAAGVTAEMAKKLSQEYQNVTNYADEVILSGENMLLTFTKIGKDIFPQATETMLDMSTALGTDLKDSAIQLGKALQDPILGVTALRRVGVSFSDAQQEVIKKMVETNHLADAQKYILAELQREFGGSAKALANPIVQLKNAVGDLGEEIGMAVLPAIKQLSKDLIPVVQNIGKWMQEHPQLTANLVKTVLAVGALSLILGSTGLAIGRIVTAVKAMNAAILYAIPAIRAMSASMLALAANPVVLLLAGIAAVGVAAYVMQKQVDDAWKGVAASAAENTARVTSQYDTWQEASKNLTGNEQKYAQIRIQMAYHMAEAVRLSEAQIEQYRMGGSQAAIAGFQEQMDYHNKKIAEMGQAALEFQKSHNVNMKKVQGAYAAVGQSAKKSNEDVNGAAGDSEDKIKKMKEAMADLGKQYNETEVAINRRLLDLKTQHRATMESLAKDLTDVSTQITKLKTDYEKSLDEMVAAHNKAINDLTATKATNLVEQFQKVKDLQQEIADFQYKPDQLQADQLVSIVENRQDKGNTISARDAQSFGLSSSQVDQVNSVLEYRREQEALVKVLKDNYTISEDLGKSLGKTFGDAQLATIQKVIDSIGDLSGAQKFEGLTDIEKTFSKIADQKKEADDNFKKQQDDRKAQYDEELAALQARKKEIEDSQKKAEEAYTAERAELIKTKIEMQGFSNDYIQNLTHVDKVTEEKLGAMKSKLEDLRNTIQSIDALLQRRADITGGGTVTEAAQAPRHAAGGVFSSPHLGWVAEAGRPEAIIPLQGGAVPVRISGSGASSKPVMVTVQFGDVHIGNGMDVRDVAGQIVNTIENQLLKTR